MFSLITQGIQHLNCSVNLQFVRYARRINFRRPRVPHFERAKYLKLCEPFYPSAKRGLSLAELCRRPTESAWSKRELDNPFERILAKEVLNWFNHSRMVIFLHANPILGEDKFKARVLLKKQTMELKEYGKKIVKMALENTKYENAIQLFVSTNLMIFGMEPRVSQLLRIMKRSPQLIIMAGIIDGKFLSYNELVAFSKLPTLPNAQAGLVTLLNSAALGLTQNLNSHQLALVGHLNKHIELQQQKKDDVS